MKISIVTICYNEEKHVLKTLKSIFDQVFLDYEYIICDGKSTDKTKKIIEEFLPCFAKKNIRVKYISEEDNGIYDAMNKGIDLCEGDYICFVNAGDELYNCKTLSLVSNELDYKYDIIYGDVLIVERGYGKVFYSDEKRLSTGMSICHQGMFIKKELMKKYHYDTSYKIIADYDFTYKMLMEKKRFRHIDLLIAKYRSNGVSTTSVERIAKEYYLCGEKYSLNFNYKKMLKSAKRNYKNSILKKMVPWPIWAIYNKIRRRERVS